MKKKNSVWYVSALLVIFSFFTYGCAIKDKAGALPVFRQEEKAGELYVHFIDVGQGNAILLRLPNSQTMLVDAGSGAAKDKLLTYLKREKIERIDYCVGTHPHEDHIGNLDSVLSVFAIGELYMPKAATTTKTFRDVVQAAKIKQLKIKTAKAGVVLVDDTKLALKVEMLAPNSDSYEALNNYSAVVKVTYKNMSVLITGDAEKLSEKEMLAKGYNLKADVLQVGHHGSGSSTSKAFVQAVAPKYAVVCVGAGNDYGHPHKETLQTLAAAAATVYRTDIDGSVVGVTDGVKIDFFTN